MAEPIDSPAGLVAAREARGLAPDAAARELRLALRQLEALERGDWAALPGLAFVRGALRSYGRLLGVDVEPLLAQVAATVQVAELRPIESLGQPLPTRSLLGFGQGGGGSRVAWAGLVVVVALVLAAFFGGGVPMSSIRSWLGGVPESGSAPQSTQPSAEPAAPVPPAVSETAPASRSEVQPVPAAAAKPAPTPVPARPATGGASTVVTPVPIALPPASGAPESATAGGPAAVGADGPRVPAPTSQKHE